MEASKNWQEIEDIIKHNRRELVLTGKSFSEKLERSDGKLPDDLFNEDFALNFLDFSHSILNELPTSFGKLTSLTNLVLRNNQLSQLPPSFSKLRVLKFLDLSSNKLSSLDGALENLTLLESLMVSNNNLTELPDLSKLEALHILEVSNNQVTQFPLGLLTLKKFQCFKAEKNLIDSLPDNINEMATLKELVLSENKLTSLPSSLSACTKLKTLQVGGNKLTDHRLAKMAQQCHTKSVLEYLAKQSNEKSQKGGGKKKQKTTESESQSASVKVVHFQNGAQFEVKVFDNVVPIREHILCCIIRSSSFTSNTFKQFISLQTKLHDSDLCAKRKLATIATHDLDKIKSNLLYYSAFEPQKVSFIPLGRAKEIQSSSLIEQLWKEADDSRRKSKRNAISGIHKYLELVHKQPLCAFLYQETHPADSEEPIRSFFSFPPLTNGEISKIEETTKNILIEITSPKSVSSCKNVMEEFLRLIFENNLVMSDTEEGAASDEKNMVLEQIKIVAEDGKLKVVYPAKDDLGNMPNVLRS